MSRLRNLRVSKRSSTRKTTSRSRESFAHRSQPNTTFATSQTSVTTTLAPRSQLVSRILLKRPVSIYISAPLPRWIRISLTDIPDDGLEIIRRLHTPSRPLSARVITFPTPPPSLEPQLSHSMITIAFMIPYSFLGLHFVYSLDFSQPL